MWPSLFRHRRLDGNGGTAEVTRQGMRWRLHLDHYLDREILRKGAFEKKTTRLVRRIVKPGMHVLDVGANFGYFTTLLAHHVGPQGHVWAVEPTRCFRSRIAWHLQANGLTDRVTIVPHGLSDRASDVEITIGESSATLHPVSVSRSSASETISLKRLDDISGELGIRRLDFVKVDIDGHEPMFLDGACELLQRHMPIVVIEFCEANLRVAGSDVHALRLQMEELGYTMYSERKRRPFRSNEEFVAECGSLRLSANVWGIPRKDRRRRL
jgi:FkbM family methyltransferase